MKKIIKSFSEWIKTTYLFKKVAKFYGWIIHVLFLTKWVSAILAYGGIHIMVLIILFCYARHMWIELEENNITSFNQIIYKFHGDTLNNYRLNYLNFEKDMRRRPKDIFNTNDINFSYGFEKIKKGLSLLTFLIVPQIPSEILKEKALLLPTSYLQKFFVREAAYRAFQGSYK